MVGLHRVHLVNPSINLTYEYIYSCSTHSIHSAPSGRLAPDPDFSLVIMFPRFVLCFQKELVFFLCSLLLSSFWQNSIICPHSLFFTQMDIQILSCLSCYSCFYSLAPIVETKILNFDNLLSKKKMVFLTVFKKDNFYIPSNSQPLTEDCAHSRSLPIIFEDKGHLVIYEYVCHIVSYYRSVAHSSNKRLVCL